MDVQGTIKRLVDKIKHDRKLEVYIFYQEAPIRYSLEVSEIDEGKKQIEFKINGKIEAAVSEAKEVYCKLDKEVLVMKALIWNREYLVTSFPSFAIEPKLNRSFPRVKCSNKNPITMEDKSIGLCLNIRDISEGGIGFKLPEDVDIKENNIHNINLIINGKTYTAKIKIVYRVKTDDKLIKIGASFVELSPRLEDAVARYVMDRQMEIARVLNTFAD